MAAILIALTLASCASIQPATDAAMERRVGQVPVVGEVVTVTVGEPVIAVFDYMIGRRAVTQVDFSRAIGINRMYVPAGTQLYRAVIGGSQEGWCSSGAAFFALGEARRMCFFDPSGMSAPGGRPGRFTEGYVAGTARGTEVAVDIPYRIIDATSGTGSRQELLYQGLDRGVLRLSYREFVTDLARPAYTQDLTYTLEPRGRPTMIAFRGARIEVLEAGNNQIRYRVISSLQ